MFWWMLGAFCIGFVVGSVIDLISRLRKIKYFFEMSNFDKEEPYLEDVKAHYEYAVMVAPGYDYFIWSFCPYREKFETPGECKIWNCPGCQIGSHLQCKGLKHSCGDCTKESCEQRNNYLWCSDFEGKDK